MADAKMGHKKVKVAGDKPEHRVQIAVTADTNRLVPLAFAYLNFPERMSPQ